MTEDNNYLKELLETRLDSIAELHKQELGSIAELLRSELTYLRVEVKKIEDSLDAHACQNEEINVEFRASVVRIHSRIDILEKRLEAAETPRKANAWDVIWTSALMAVPYIVGAFLIWILTSGALVSFLNFLASHAK